MDILALDPSTDRKNSAGVEVNYKLGFLSDEAPRASISKDPSVALWRELPKSEIDGVFDANDPPSEMSLKIEFLNWD